MTEPVALTINSFCDRYEISRRQAYRLIDKGEIEAFKIGRAVRITTKSARQWADRQPRMGAYPTLTGTNNDI
jgi:excisionase family DNA binding protein